MDSKQQTDTNTCKQKALKVDKKKKCIVTFFLTNDLHFIFLFLSVPQQRNLSFTCVETHTFPVFFNASSFLQLPGRANHNTVSVGFQFRTWNPDGLLLFSNLDDGTLEISLEDGKITIHINVSKAARNYRVDLLSGEFDVQSFLYIYFYS